MQEKTVTVQLKRPEGSIAYDDSASEGRLVICVPSMGDLRSEYRFLSPLLESTGYRVVTMDVRGHGESTTGWSDHSAAAIGSDIVELIRHLDAGPAAVIGTSMAAGSAVWAAAETPDLVSDIVAIGPFVRDIPGSALQKAAVALAFRGPWKVKAWSAAYKSFYGDFPPEDLAEHRRAIERNLSEPGRFAALREMLAASKADCERRIPEVRARSLVIMGSRDPDFKDPRAEAKLVADRLRGTFVIAEGAGHYPHVEKPDETADVVTRHLRREETVA